MRSFSTLLSHQIGSNPEVAGYFEAHQKYRNWLDLIDLAEKVRRGGGHDPGGRLLFDKILHPLEIRDAVLRRRDLKVILLVREPEATVRSILKIRAGGIDSLDQAVQYYLQSLRRLGQILDRRHGRALFLEAEALIEEPEITLATITDYLGLTVALTQEYDLFPLSGKGKFGDPSGWIKSRTIVRKRKRKRKREPDQAQAREGGFCLEVAREAYEAFSRYAAARAECVVARPRMDDLARLPNVA